MTLGRGSNGGDTTIGRLPDPAPGRVWGGALLRLLHARPRRREIDLVSRFVARGPPPTLERGEIPLGPGISQGALQSVAKLAPGGFNAVNPGIVGSMRSYA